MLRQSKQKDKPGCAGLEKIGFPKPLQPAARPCSAAATFIPRVLPRTLKRSMRMCVAQAEPPDWALQGETAKQQRRLLPAVHFPAKIIRFRNHAQRKSLLVHHLNKGNRNTVMFSSRSRWTGAWPSPALAGHHQLLTCSSRMSCARSNPGLRSRPELRGFVADW